jgi:Tfp pilus assembly protein PilV
MRRKLQYRGFSLIEVLLAVGTLAIGMIFIGGTFLVGIHFTTIATERTIAAVAADEAFAKIRLYGVNLADPNLAVDQLTPFEALNPIAQDEFAYPSTKSSAEKQYYWSALCRLVASDATNRGVQVTVFVSRKVGSATKYQGRAVNRPVPVKVAVSGTLGSDVLTIREPDKKTWINDGCTVVDNQTGQLYRVVRRDADAPDTIVLDRVWQSGLTGTVWVVPPPMGGGRYPCIVIYQKVIRF